MPASLPVVAQNVRAVGWFADSILVLGSIGIGLTVAIVVYLVWF